MHEQHSRSATRYRAVLGGLATAAIVALATTPAHATVNLQYQGLVTSADPVASGAELSHLNSSDCSDAPDGIAAGGAAGPAHYQAFAVRSTSFTAECVTVSNRIPFGSFGCDSAHTAMFDSYRPGFDPTSPGSNYAGGLNFSLCGPSGPYNYSFEVGNDDTATVVVFGGQDEPNPSVPYSVNVSTNYLQPAMVARAGATIPGGNTLSINASTLTDGSSLEGSLSDSDGRGRSYSGALRCLRFSGHNASLVMSIYSSSGIPATERGAVYWLHQGSGGSDASGQRNSVLTQHQLDKLATCPDPNSPPGGSFKALEGGYISVIDAAPTSTGTS